jgi:transposase
MTNRERGQRQRDVISAYMAGETSRQVAERFGISSSYVRTLIGLWGVSRPVGRPRNASA